MRSLAGFFALGWLLSACTSFSGAEVSPGAGGAAGAAGALPGGSGGASGSSGQSGAAGSKAGSGPGAGASQAGSGQGGAGGAGKAGSPQAGQAGSAQAGSPQAGQGGSEQAGSGQGGSAQAGSGQGGQGGSAQAGQGGAGQGGSEAAGQGGSGASGGQGGQAGQGGSGQACGGLLFKCEGNLLLVCSDKGDGFVPLETCGDGLCDASTGICLASCPQGEKRCLGDTRQICASGAWQDVDVCQPKLCTPGGCVSAICGNDQIDPGEDCDGASVEPCSQYIPGASGIIQCSSSCKADLSSCQYCGNGKVDPGEECDTAAAGPLACGQFIPGSTGAATCKAGCVADTSACQFCGNGKLEGSEACDGAAGNLECASLSPGSLGSAQCSGACQVDMSTCEVCGDGVVNAAETCEGGSVGQASCALLTGSGGALACKGCRLDTTGCDIPSCGYKGGLVAAAPWPAQGGCMRRPRRTHLAGPSITPTPMALYGTNFSPDFAFNEPTIDPSGTIWHFRVSSSVIKITGNGSKEILLKETFNVIGSPTLTSAGVLVLGVNRLNLIDASDAVSSFVLPEQATGDLVVTQDGEPHYYFPTMNRLYHGGVGSPPAALGAPLEFSIGGTFAYDDVNDWIVGSEANCVTCRVFGISRQGNVLWQTTVPGGGAQYSHVALGSDGSVFVRNGGALSSFNPQNSQKIHTLNTAIKFGKGGMPVAVLPDGTVRVITPDASGNLELVAASASLAPSWKAPLTSPNGPPLVDRDGNTYVCQEGSVVSFDAGGAKRWEAPIAGNINTCLMAMRADGKLVVSTRTSLYEFSAP